MKKNLRAKYQHSFWAHNTTNRNVCLADLALTIPAWRSYDLLDSRHFHYTLEQLEQSLKSGSLFTKQDKIKVTNQPPETILPSAPPADKPMRITPLRSNVQIVEKIYPELPSSDEKFADEFSEPDEK